MVKMYKHCSAKALAKKRQIEGDEDPNASLKNEASISTIQT